MNYYNLLKLNNFIKNPRIKFLGIYLLHILNKRYLSVNFDPINACNLRCKMCYFTDKEHVKKLKGVFKPEELFLFSKAILNRALKLQIECGTEPTLYKNLDKVIKEATKYNVPYIALTTNANLLEKETIEKWTAAGLNEITVSLHGVYKNTYEEMMGKGDYDRFLASLSYIDTVKKIYPNLKLRVNYTFNEDNFDELRHFWNVFDKNSIDILQIRPISKLGNTEYNNFSLNKIIPKYNSVYKVLIDEAAKRNITFLAPDKNQLINRNNSNNIIYNYTYCYISPTYFWRNDFNWKTESFNDYSKRTHWSKQILQLVFTNKNNLNKIKNKSLNYDIL